MFSSVLTFIAGSKITQAILVIFIGLLVALSSWLYISKVIVVQQLSSAQEKINKLEVAIKLQTIAIEAQAVVIKTEKDIASATATVISVTEAKKDVNTEKYKKQIAQLRAQASTASACAVDPQIMDAIRFVQSEKKQ